MEHHFRRLSDALLAEVAAGEVLLLRFSGEDSDFARLNHGRVRQAGHVRQQGLGLELVAAGRQAGAALELCGELERDLAEARAALAALRERLPHLPEDPHLNYATERHDSRDLAENGLPPAEGAVAELLEIAEGLDLVGLWAGGESVHGFANSLGQRNWHSRHSFNLDYSVYDHGDKAVKQSYAGSAWERTAVEAKIAEARATVEILGREPVRVPPGRYRVYLAPAALEELVGLLGWGGFGLKSHRTAQTPLLRMVREGLSLSPEVSLTEHHAGGLAPRFTGAGFITPEQVPLITDGAYADCLAGPRSAREYGAVVNCAVESPRSLEMAAGDLPQEGIYEALGTGIYVSNLWYCNYSDRNHCRITGMTRFACLWVEEGRPVAPLAVMRFDESLYHALGNGLLGLTRERERLLDPGTYGGRSQASALLPGALVEDFSFTL